MEHLPSVRQLHAIIHGRVQGVSFRYNAQREAQRLHLVGWVRNLPDGTVETVAEGDDAHIQQYADWLRRGPSGAVVTAVDTDWDNAPSNFTSFEIHYGTE
jgi:acylphosphatase